MEYIIITHNFYNLINDLLLQREQSKQNKSIGIKFPQNEIT